MLRSVLAHALRVCCLFPLLCPAVCAASEHTIFEVIWIETRGAGAARQVPSLMNVPAAWRPGDAVAVLLFDPPGALEVKDVLLGALLDRGSAVLELDVNSAYGFSAESSHDPSPPTAESLVADLEAALQALRRQYAAGVVVAIGHGPGAQAVMLSAENPETGFSAFAGLGSAATVFRAGPPLSPAEGWSARAPILCDALAWARAAVATPVAFNQQAHDVEAATCRSALLSR
jgi:hypothetical protein